MLQRNCFISLVAVLAGLSLPDAVADVLETRDGLRIEGLAVFLADGRIELRKTDGAPQQFSQAQIKRVEFDPAQTNRLAFVPAEQRVAGLYDLTYKFYHGSWLKMPDFAMLNPAKSGRMTGRTLDLQVAGQSDYFAMLYEGTLWIPKAGRYSFKLGSDEGSYLKIRNQQVIDHDGVHTYSVKEGGIDLQAGTNSFQVGYFEGRGEERLTIEWSGPGFTNTVLSASGPMEMGTMLQTALADGWALPPGVMSWSGTFFAGYIESMDDTKVVMANAPTNLTLTVVNSSALLFQAVSSQQVQKLRGRKPGVLLRNGDYVEGKIKSIEADRIRFESVLFGLRQIDLNGEAAAALLDKPTSAKVPFSLHLRNGSRWLTSAATIDAGGITLPESFFGGRRVSRDQLIEIRYAPASDLLSDALLRWEEATVSQRELWKYRSDSLSHFATQHAQTHRVGVNHRRVIRESIVKLPLLRAALTASEREKMVASEARTAAKVVLDKATGELQKRDNELALAKEAHRKAIEQTTAFGKELTIAQRTLDTARTLGNAKLQSVETSKMTEAKARMKRVETVEAKLKLALDAGIPKAIQLAMESLKQVKETTTKETEKSDAALELTRNEIRKAIEEKETVFRRATELRVAAEKGIQVAALKEEASRITQTEAKNLAAKETEAFKLADANLALKEKSWAEANNFVQAQMRDSTNAENAWIAFRKANPDPYNW